MNEETVKRIDAHLAHAKEKHPQFCTELLRPDTPVFASDELEATRAVIKLDAEQGHVFAEELLLCECREIYEAIAAEQKAYAIEECYDAIAVLLRMVEELR